MNIVKFPDGKFAVKRTVGILWWRRDEFRSKRNMCWWRKPYEVEEFCLCDSFDEAQLLMRSIITPYVDVFAPEEA